MFEPAHCTFSETFLAPASVNIFPLFENSDHDFLFYRFQQFLEIDGT